MGKLGVDRVVRLDEFLRARLKSAPIPYPSHAAAPKENFVPLQLTLAREATSTTGHRRQTSERSIINRMGVGLDVAVKSVEQRVVKTSGVAKASGPMNAAAAVNCDSMNEG
jgi:hypothetical protein